MMGPKGDPLFERSPANPLLTADDVPYAANSIFNPGAARVGNETILLARVEDLRGSPVSTWCGARTAFPDGGSTQNSCCGPMWSTFLRRSGAAKIRA